MKSLPFNALSLLITETMETTKVWTSMETWAATGPYWLKADNGLRLGLGNICGSCVHVCVCETEAEAPEQIEDMSTLQLDVQFPDQTDIRPDAALKLACYRKQSGHSSTG